MTRLKLADIVDEKPVRLHVELPARLHRQLLAYAVAVKGSDPGEPPSPERLIPAMIERFIATDRQFAKTGKRADGRSGH